MMAEARVSWRVFAVVLSVVFATIGLLWRNHDTRIASCEAYMIENVRHDAESSQDRMALHAEYDYFRQQLNEHIRRDDELLRYLQRKGI